MNAALLILLLAAVPEPVVLADFNAGDASDHLRMRSIGVAEISVEDGATASGGGAISLMGSGKRGSVERRIEVGDWRRFSALSFYARVPGRTPIKMRVRARTGRGRAAMLCRATIEPGPWREVRLPLAMWREDTYDQAGDFARVESIEIQLDNGNGKLDLDDLRLWPGDRGELSCTPTEKDWLALAFPDGDGKAYSSEHFLLLTNAPRGGEARAKKLLGIMEQGFEALTERLKVPTETWDRAPVFFFATKGQYGAFFERLGERYRLGISAPTSSGYSCLGIGASYYDRKYGWERPAFTHETVHAALHRRLGLASNGSWVQEALACSVQIHLRPSSLDRGAFRKELATYAAGKKGRFLPLGEVLLARRVTTRHYTQLYSFLEFLRAEHPEVLPAIWKAVRESAEPVREAAAEAVLEALDLVMPELDAAFAKWWEVIGTISTRVAFASPSPVALVTMPDHIRRTR